MDTPKLLRIAVAYSSALLAVMTLTARAASPLDDLHPNWPEQKLEISLIQPPDRSVARGGPIAVSINATQGAYFVILLVDSQGNARLFLPSSDGPDVQLSPGEPRIFPDTDDGEILPADMVPGSGRVYVIASSTPLLANLGPAETHDTAGLLRSVLSSTLTKAGASRVTWDFTPLTVKDPSPVDMLTAHDVVDFFAHRVQGRGAQQGLLVQFDFNSDRLGSLGKLQLDQLGMGLNDPEIRGQHFILEGHTDDIGSDEYNRDLSLRRARAALDYLVNQQRVDPKRLSAVGVGAKDMVTEPRDDLDRRRENSRRVVIRRADN